MKKIKTLKSVISIYQAVICDLWGVLHNGVKAFPGATRTLKSLREIGIPVILLSNSPRPSGTVQKQIKGFGVDEGCYDKILTSGDLARRYIRSLPETVSFFHIGPKRDLPTLAGLRHPQEKTIEKADVILCTGFFENFSMIPEDYKSLLNDPASRKKTMVCANPDYEVDIGKKRFLCAGALAAFYETLGGPVIWLGKPEKIAYENCLGYFERKIGGKIKPKEILAIGDNPKTDITGAQRLGFDSLFITDGLHGKTGADKKKVKKLFSPEDDFPTYFMKRLEW